MDPRLIPRASLRPRGHQAEKAVHWHYCSHQLGLNHHPHRVWNEGLLRSLGKDYASPTHSSYYSINGGKVDLIL